MEKICHEKSAEVIVPQKREGPNNFGQSKIMKGGTRGENRIQFTNWLPVGK